MKYLVLLIFSMHFFFLSFADNGPAKKDNTKKDNIKNGLIKSNLPIKGYFIKPPVKYTIDNGSFESGNLNSWDYSGDGNSVVSVVDQNNGPYPFEDYFGGERVYTAYGNQFLVQTSFFGSSIKTLYQDVTIPNDAVLKWYDRIYHSGIGNSIYKVEIIISGTATNLYERSISDLTKDDRFNERTAYLNSYAGQTVRIAFTMELGQYSLFLLDNVSLTGTIPSTPSISISNPTASLTSCLGSASSSPTTFIVTGSDLTGNITVTAPSDFEISSGGAYSTSLILTKTATNTVNQTLNVRLKDSPSSGAKSGTITATSTGATAVTTTVNGTVNALPTVTVTKAETSGTTSNDAIICSGASITLSGVGASSYVWNNSITNGLSFAPSTTTAYTVTGTDANGCVNTAIQTVTVNALPTVTVTKAETSGTTSNDAIICSGASITLSGVGASSYVWNNGITNGSSFAPSTTTAYTVTGTDGNSCVNTAIQTVTVNALPNITISGTTTNVELVTLTGIGGATYAWSGGSSKNTASNTFDASGLYSLLVTDANSCISSTLLNINVQHWGLSKSGENTLDSASQINKNGQIGSLYPLSPHGKITVYKPNISVGSRYGGGIVFYITDDGAHGLIAAESDQSAEIRWLNGSPVTTSATATAIGTGLANTNTIISVQGATATSYAAGLARAYTGGGYSDWYLPSKDELNKLYINRIAIGGFADNYYWSSTERDHGLAWYQYFNGGGQGDYDKGTTFFVRAIRAF